MDRSSQAPGGAPRSPGGAPQSPAGSPQPTAGAPPRQHHLLTLAVLALAALVFALSQTMILPALPTIQQDLATSGETASWVLTAFLLTASVATPIVGRLGDIYGKDRVLLLTMCAFGLGSLIAALSHSIELLIAGRAIQGIGGAVFPLAFGIVRDEFPREKVALGIGLVSATFGIGGGGGLVLSGLIVDRAPYQWIFWTALLAVALALPAIRLFVPPSPVRARVRIDWVGAAGLSLLLVAFLLGVTQGPSWGWSSPGVLGLLLASVLLAVAWVRLELRAPEPLVDMRMMRQRGVFTTNAAILLVGFGMFGSFVLLPQFVEIPTAAGYGFGASATGVSAFMLPGTAATLLGGMLAGALGERYGSKLPMVTGVALLGAGLGSFAFLHDDPWMVYAGNALLGGGVGLALAAAANLIVEAVRQDQTGVATGINTIMRTIGGAIGAQVAASVLASYPASSTGLSEAAALPSEAGFTFAFAVTAGAVAVGLLIALAIPSRDQRDEMQPRARGEVARAT